MVAGATDTLMDDGTDEATLRARMGASRAWTWVVLDAPRWVVAALLSAAVFLAIVAVGLAHPVPARSLLSRSDPLETLYQALVTSTITGVTLVLTLSQLVLSQELGAVGDQRERMEGALDFRSDVADELDRPVSPAEPSAFLGAMVAETGDRARAVGDAVDGGVDPEPRSVVRDYVADVAANADTVAEELDGAAFGRFEVVRAALDYDYSWKLHAGHRIAAEYADELPEQARDRLDDLLSMLELFGPAREHVKTLYFQWELSALSRTLLLAAVPALTVAIGALLFLSPGDLPAVPPVPVVLLTVAATTTVALVPFAVLLAYVLRIVTVTERTLSIGPFVLRSRDRSPVEEWE